MPVPARSAFPWQRTRAVVEELLTIHALRVHGDGRLIAGPGHRPDLVVVPPAVLPRAEGDPLVWLDNLPDHLGVEVIILLRAASAALGLWIDDELVLHKVFKRYVVRRHGKAQSTHLKTRGKSRYGSRLRLQQARLLLRDVNERLARWELDDGPFVSIHRACPPRLWADLCATEPPPPFDARDPRIRRIALHVHEPSLDELRRVRRALCHGRIERPTAADECSPG